MRSSLLIFAAISACSSNSNGPTGTDVPPGTDVVGDGGTNDVTAVDTAMPPVDVPTDSSQMMGRCGTERPVLTGATGPSEGLVIGPDGTIYYSQPGSVGRIVPGMAPQNDWIAESGATVWGLALDAVNNKLYIGVPSGRIDVADLNNSTPTATRFLSNAGQPNGLTIGPDGALWYTDFSGGHAYRVSPEGMRSRVTTSTIPGADGIAFGADGKLYVTQYSEGGGVIRLDLTNNLETARLNLVPTGAGGADGLAFDAMGRMYVTAGGRLIRYDADGTNQMVLQMGLTGAANIEFGAGALRCTDIYVATGRTASGGMGRSLFRYEMGDTPGAAVPWHR